MNHLTRIVKTGLIVVAAILLTAGWADAGVLLNETFEGTSTGGGTVYGGVFEDGYEGQGWRSTATADEMDDPVFIQYQLANGFLAGRGTIEFRFKRISPPTGDGLDGFFTVLDEAYVPLVKVVIQWQSAGTVFGGQPVLKLATDPLTRELAGLPWGGMFVGLGTDLPVGAWNHLSMTWGPGPDDNQIRINGRRASGAVVRGVPDWVEPEPGMTVGSLLARAAFLRIGAEGYQYGPAMTTYSPMTDAVIDDFRIHDEIFNPLDPPPVIDSVAHDAFSTAGYSGKLVAGDLLTVTLVGESGCTATFDVGEKIKAVQMTEDVGDPGTYVGTVRIKSGDDVEEGSVVGHLADQDGFTSKPLAAQRPVDIDTTVYMKVSASNDLVPADESARSGLTVVAEDANGKAARDHELKLTLSTTDEYTGTVGGGSFEDQVGGTIDVDWGGVTDSFGEVTAQYISGFAAKTILVSAKDMATGDVGVGWVRSYIDGTVDIVVTEPRVSALSVAGTMDISLSRDWLTADGQSRSRITAVVKDASGEPMSGHSVQFTLLGNNGAIRVVQSKTDSRGRAVADYIAGTVMGQVQVEVRDLTSGLTAIVSIELRPDAPAEITLTAEPAEVVTGGETTVTAKVTDVNKNPNQNVDVIYNVLVGNGNLSSSTVPTDEKGNASVTFTAGDFPGLVTLRGTVISREPTAEEISAAAGAVFLYGLTEDPGRLDVVEWLSQPGDEVVEGQPLVTLEDRADTVYTVVAPRDGILSTFMAEERDRVEYGDTLGYVIEVAE